MPDLLGNINVPEPPVNGTFPLTIEWGYVREVAPTPYIHTFGSANRKIEQRYESGNGVRRISLTFPGMDEGDRTALRDFWEARKGGYEAFTLNYQNEDGSGSTTAMTVAFENEPLSWQQLDNLLSGAGVRLIEIPTSTPSYSVSSTVTRFPSGGLATALLAQEQRIIPLIKIAPTEAGYPAIYISDRRVTVGGQLYLPRLLRVPTVEQSISGETDSCEIACGNADRVMRDLAEDVRLIDAVIEVSLFHVGSTTKIDLWKGVIDSWGGSEDIEFAIRGRDPIGDARTLYPPRIVERACWKPFDSDDCPYSTVGSGGNPAACNKSVEDCIDHGMIAYHGGINARPQQINIKQNSWWGLRSKITSPSSTVNDSIYGQPLQEIYTDADMPVNCLLAGGREENEFYVALGIVGAGPISGYASDNKKHRLDGQTAHFEPEPLGLRRSFGHDPVQDNDPDADSNEFSLGPTFTGDKAAGIAFIEIRRKDPTGYQLSRAADHAMQATVSGGLGGWYWDDPGTRLWAAPNTNPVWITVNAWLRSKRLWAASAADQLAVFDVDAAIAAAAICSDTVPVLVGAGTETQFKFRGSIADIKPVRDWLLKILKNCLGYYISSWAKLKIGIRINSSAVSTFTAGNIIADSLKPDPIQPNFNGLSLLFANAEYEYKDDSVPLADEDLQVMAGAQNSQMRVMGVYSKSHAARLVVTNLREEIGGVDISEWRKARRVSFRTTILALDTEPGQVVSITDDAMPGGYGEIRIARWRLNPDYSIDIEGQTTTDAMYNLAVGPKPEDVAADSIPGELITDPVPADVRAIGSDAFLLTKSEDGTTATIDIEYDPPDPIGAFTGVNIQIQAPDGFDYVIAAGEWEYKGDPGGVGAARYGLATIKAPQPVAGGETWRIYLVSVSRTVRKALVLHPASNASPNRTVAISAATTAGAQPLPGDVAIVGSPTIAYYIAANGERRVFITINYTAPSVDFNDFSGVEIFGYTPAYGSGTPMVPTVEFDHGWRNFTGVAGDPWIAEVDMLAPDRTEGWQFYLAAGRNQVIKESPWPDTGVITVTASGAVNVSSFGMGLSSYATGRRALLLPYALTLPAGASWDVLDWDRVELHIRTASMSPLDLPSVAAVMDRGTGPPGTAVTSNIEIVDLPDSNELWTVTAQSFKLNGDRHTGAPTALIFVDPPPQAPDPHAVTSFSASVTYMPNESGVQMFRFEGSWVNPTGDPDFVGVQVKCLWAGATAEQDLATEKEGSTSFWTDFWPIQDTSQIVTIRAYSINVDGGLNASPPAVALTVTPGGTGTIKGNRLATGTLGSSLTISGGQLQVSAGGITSPLLAAAAVTTAALANLAVDNSKLASLAVDAAKLANSAVTAVKIDNAAVGSAAIASLAVGTAHIANAAVTNAKVSDLSVSKLTAGTAAFFGDVTFANTGSLFLLNGGGITINPGSINCISIFSRSLGTGWDIVPGSFPTITGSANSAISVAAEYRVNGTRVVGARQAAVFDISISVPAFGGNVADACSGNLFNVIQDTKDKVNQILNRLRSHGLIF